MKKNKFLALIMFIFMFISSIHAENNKYGQNKFIINLENLFRLQYGWDELYERYNDENLREVQLLSNIKFGAEYCFLDQASIGLALASNYQSWDKFYDLDICVKPALRYYFIINEMYNPYVSAWYEYQFLREYSGAGVNRRNHYRGISLGITQSFNDKLAVDYSVSYSRDKAKIVNSLIGNRVFFSIGLKCFL